MGEMVDPNAVLAQNGVNAVPPPQGSDVSGMEPPGAASNLPAPSIPALPPLSGAGAGPLPGRI
jgi:hypothetical protein